MTIRGTRQGVDFRRWLLRNGVRTRQSLYDQEATYPLSESMSCGCCLEACL